MAELSIIYGLQGHKWLTRTLHVHTACMVHGSFYIFPSSFAAGYLLLLMMSWRCLLGEQGTGTPACCWGNLAAPGSLPL